jgi:hypothetical protein
VGFAFARCCSVDKGTAEDAGWFASAVVALRLHDAGQPDDPASALGYRRVVFVF